jgi:outer membrane receptor for ferrienterochelin and colicin
MQRLRGWLASALAVSLSGVSGVPVALADERTDARREFRVGMQAVADGRYDEAIAHLENAYDILPHPNVLYNLGLVHMYAGRPEEAVAYFERYRETAPPDDAAEVDALIAGLSQKETLAAAERAAAQPTTDKSDVAAALENSAREIRRAAEPTQNEALLHQAIELEHAARALRQGRPPEKEAKPDKTAATPTTPGPTPPPAQVVQQATREGMYEEEVVSASRFAQSPLDAPNATAIITAQDIRMTGHTQLTNLLRRVAGVEVNTVAPTHSEVSIRGLNRRTSNKVLFLIDGRSYRLDFLASSWFDQLPISLEDVERIEVIRGPASALYGADAFSGIINVITRTPGKGGNFVQGSGGSDGMARGVASFTGRNGALAYRAGFGYGQSNNAVLAASPDRVDVQNLASNYEKSAQGAWGNGELRYDLGRQTVATVGATAQYGTNTVQGLSRLGQITSPHAFALTSYATLTTPVGIRLSTWWNHSTGDGAGPSAVTPGSIESIAPKLAQEIIDSDLSWASRFKLVVPNTFTIGGGYRYKHIEWSYLDDDHSQHHFGAYVQDVLQLARQLTLQLGARVDYHPLLSQPPVSPRGSLVYRFAEGQSLRANIGKAFRGPSFAESYVQIPNGTPLRGVTVYGLGNDKLDPEGIVSYELGYQNQASDYFALEANVYFNMVKDAILFTNFDRFTLGEYAGAGPGDLAQFDPSVSAYPLSSLSFVNERATFQQIGGEVGVRFYPVPGLDIYSNYSVHDTQPMKKDKGEIDPARAKEQQTSLHKVNAGIQYRAKFGLDLSTDLSWFSSQVWVEQVVDTERGVRFETFDQPAFAMLNARIGYRLLQNRLELGVVGTNLAFQDKRQHPFGQPMDTRVFGTAKLKF